MEILKTHDRIYVNEQQKKYSKFQKLPSIHSFNSRRHKLKKVARRHKGGGVQSDPSPLLLTPFIRLTIYLAHIMSVLCTFN